MTVMLDIIIENRLHKSDSSLEMRTLGISISILINITLISSGSSRELLDNKGNDD